MADNWWDSSSRTRPCLDSVSVTTSNINLFQDTHDPTTTAAATTSTTGGATTTLHMMGLGLSSQSLPQSLDWNQALPRGDQKSYRNLLQDQDHNLSSNTNTFQLENNQWRSQKIYSTNSQDSPSDFKQINIRGFQLDHQPMHESDNESIITSQGLNSSFQSMDLYGNPSSTIMQTLFGSDNNNQQQQQDSGFEQNQGMNAYSLYQSSFGGMTIPGGGGEVASSNWSKFPSQSQELIPINAPQKVQLPDIGGSQLHFANNARFWNASGVNVARSSFFPSLQMQLPSSTFEDKAKITSKIAKESSSESSSNKRPRTETQSTLPAFNKVKKEKMGDRITALQQLVSPFGKTDTASVLSEAFEYIKFLHEQVSVLSTPYMKNGASIMQQQQMADKSAEGVPRQDLRSRGLCLVPVSSTFPVTHETTVDFWTPTFGGTFR